MSLHLTLCGRCGKHGRFIGMLGTKPIEVASKQEAYKAIACAKLHRIVSEARALELAKVVRESFMADVEESHEIDVVEKLHTFVEPQLRQHVQRWNEAARWTNGPDQFGQTDFHDYVRLLEAPAAPCGNPQPN